MTIRTGHTARLRTPDLDPPLLPGIERPPAWMADGLCAQVDPEIFYPEKRGSTREAKKICKGGCEVRAECLAYALEHHERFGIWGGLSERERRRLERAPRQPNPIPHGTHAGYAAHRRRNEPACVPCLEGLADYKRSRKAKLGDAA